MAKTSVAPSHLERDPCLTQVQQLTINKDCLKGKIKIKFI